MTVTNEEIPRSVAAVVADVLAAAMTHTGIDVLFQEHGAPGDPPIGNKIDKVQGWLTRVNREHATPLKFLGKAIEAVMDMPDVEVDPWGTLYRTQEEADRENERRKGPRSRIAKALGEHGLSYSRGGHIAGARAAPPARALSQILRERDFAAIKVEFDRAVSAAEKDPPTAVTAACALVEAALLVHIEDRGLDVPDKKDISSLWKVAQKDLNLDPSRMEDDDLRRILSGLASIVAGIGALRTHTGSAHGRGRKPYALKPRHARLAVHAASTLVFYIAEVWDERTEAVAAP